MSYSDIEIIESGGGIEVIEAASIVVTQDAVAFLRSFSPTAIDPGDNATILQAINFLLQAVRDLQIPANVVTYNGQPLTYNGQTVTYTP